VSAMTEISAGKPIDLSPYHGSIIDCDIHPSPPSIAELLPYFDEYWKEVLTMRGIDRVAVDITAAPPNVPVNSRPDWRPAKGRPGSDLALMQRHVLDGFGSAAGICNCLHVAQIVFGDDLAAAMCTALNKWLAAEWLDRDPRLRASIVVPIQNPQLAAAEIERWAADRRFVQVLLPGTSDMPYGRRYYWPIYAAAARHGLSIGIHAGSSYRNAPTPTGWPSYFLSDYIGFSSIAESQLLSLLSEGVFVEYPNLKVVFIETGFLWYPSFIWRANKTWRGVRAEVPWLKEAPGTLAERHVRFTIQPVDAPPTPDQLERAIDQMGSDRFLLFSSDYPHWHYDGLNPLPAGFPTGLLEKIAVENPTETYPRLQKETAQ